MFRVERYILGLVLLVTVACTKDSIEPTPSTAEQDEAVITIYGGRPRGSLSTRSVNQPALPGACQADKMQIWVYTQSGEDYAWQTPDKLTLKETLSVMDVLNTNESGGSIDRWAKRQYTYSFRRAFGLVHGNHFAIPALSYTDADVSKFSVATGANYTLMALSLSASALATSPMVTPELYFGRLRFLTSESALKGYWDDTDGINNWNQYGYFYYRNTNAGSGTNDYTHPLSGHLYRIVSQINVNMTDVPTSIVDHLDLYMTNVPKQIGLYGTHGNIYSSDNGAAEDIGRFYPVTAATTSAACIDGNTLVATTNDFTGDEAHMSLFLLPSEVGGELTLRVHYKPGAVKDNMGNDVLQRDYVIQPGKSALMTGDDADVYSVSDASLRSGSDLYVYNSTNHKFYSYANVRVNINGKYENVAAEEQDVDINLEVEPGYEREHRITIN